MMKPSFSLILIFYLPLILQLAHCVPVTANEEIVPADDISEISLDSIQTCPKIDDESPVIISTNPNFDVDELKGLLVDLDVIVPQSIGRQNTKWGRLKNYILEHGPRFAEFTGVCGSYLFLIVSLGSLVGAGLGAGFGAALGTDRSSYSSCKDDGLSFICKSGYLDGFDPGQSANKAAIFGALDGVFIGVRLLLQGSLSALETFTQRSKPVRLMVPFLSSGIELATGLMITYSFAATGVIPNTQAVIRIGTVMSAIDASLFLFRKIFSINLTDFKQLAKREFDLGHVPWAIEWLMILVWAHLVQKEAPNIKFNFDLGASLGALHVFLKTIYYLFLVWIFDWRDLLQNRLQVMHSKRIKWVEARDSPELTVPFLLNKKDSVKVDHDGEILLHDDDGNLIHSYPIHRILLGQSPVYASQIRPGASKAIINESGVCDKAMSAFVDFLYTGSVDLKPADVPDTYLRDLLYVSCKNQVQSLNFEFRKFMWKNYDNQNAFKMWELAELLAKYDTDRGVSFLKSITERLIFNIEKYTQEDWKTFLLDTLDRLSKNQSLSPSRLDVVAAIPVTIGTVLIKYKIYRSLQDEKHTSTLTELATFIGQNYAGLNRSGLENAADNLEDYMIAHFPTFRKQDICTISALITDPKFFDKLYTNLGIDNVLNC